MQCAKTLLIGAAAFALCATGTALAGSGTVRGEPQKLGGGIEEVYVELDADGAPRVIGVRTSAGIP